MIGRLAWAGVAAVAALATLGFAAAAATLVLAYFFGIMIAAAVMTAVLAALAALGAWLAVRVPHSDDEDGESGEHLAVRLGREMIRKQPLSAVALFGALGFVVAKRPSAAAEIGRGVAKLMLP
jgi:hypothetical protein